MNCKPGDLAVVVFHPSMNESEKELVGVIRRVVSIEPHREQGHPCWTYEGERVFLRFGFEMVEIDGLPDFALQPIRGIDTPASVDKKQSIPADGQAHALHFIRY